MQLNLDRSPLTKAEERGRENAKRLLSELSHVATPRIAQAVKPQAKNLAKQLLSATELRELADE